MIPFKTLLYRSIAAIIPGLSPIVVTSASVAAPGNQSLTLNTTGADSYVVICCKDDGIGSPMVPSSSLGGTFTSVTSYAATNGTYINRTQAWICSGVTGAAGHTFSVTFSDYGTLVVIALNSGGGVLKVDQIATAITNDTGSPYVSNSITPTVAASLAVGMFTPINFSGDGSTTTVNAPFTLRGGSSDGNYWTDSGATADLTSTSPVTVTFNNTGAPTNDAGIGLFNLYL